MEAGDDYSGPQSPFASSNVEKRSSEAAGWTGVLRGSWVTDKRKAAERRGRAGETIAAWYLRLQGWRIVATRVRTHVGEVDLVARRGRTTLFVEVKTRRTSAELDHAIDRHRLSRVAAAANMLVPRFARPGDDIRIDVILLAPRAWPRHIRNAWTG